MLTSILAPLIVFALIVLLHEGGHFVTAKLTGMKVEEFAVGFGPKLWAKQVGETLYSIRIIPLGGYNKIMGMTPGESTDPRAFTERPVWQKLIVISAGSFMNIFSAFIIVTGVLWSVGIQSFPDRPVIGSVIADSPAAMAGLLPGDRITSIAGEPVEKWTDIMGRLAGKENRIISVEVLRGGEKAALNVVPQESADGRTVVGITAELDSHPIGLGEAAMLSAERCLYIVKAVIVGFAELVTGGNGEVSGPIGVARMAGTVAEVGIAQYFLFIAVISLNLGVLNLFPIPLLDGGIFFLTLGEAIFRRKLSAQVLYYIQAVGIAILLGLFIFGMMHDITDLMK